MENINQEEKELYLISKIVAENVKGRKIALWGDSRKLRDVLKQYFDLEVSCVITLMRNIVNNKTIFDLEYLNNKSGEYYLIAFGRNYEDYYDNVIKKMGYKETNDFVYRRIKPIILENWDCSKKEYNDSFGNRIGKANAVIKRIVFKGYNNEINLGEKVIGLRNVEFDMGANQSVYIRDGVRFNGSTKFRMWGFDGLSSIYIGHFCRFQGGNFRLINHIEKSEVVINNYCTFEEEVDFHANSGKRIIIGNDCMFSRNIQLQAGDGHSLFDIETGKNINTKFRKQNEVQNQIYIGDHVWVCAKAFILNGTSIGTGSVVGGNSTVKGVFPNNCVVAGNPASKKKENIAWSRDGISEDICSCGRSKYRMRTNEAKHSISGKNVLVIGGTRFMGIHLVAELLANGNNVTVANRGNSQNNFGSRIKQLVLDLDKPETVKQVLQGKEYDVVFDNLAYCSKYVSEILSCVKCEKYVQLSSVAIYGQLHTDLLESEFNPSIFPMELCDASVNYAYGKRQAEAIVTQRFPAVNSIIVRVPFVTKTDRLYYYCKNIVNHIPMKIENLDKAISFIRESEVGEFLPWIAAQDFSGIINLASTGNVKIGDIISYIESKTKIKAIIDIENGLEAPFHYTNEASFTLNMDKAEKLGYCTSEINEWFWQLMDEYIARALKEKTLAEKLIVDEHKNDIVNEKNVSVLSMEKCTGCSACKNSCPTDAISMKSDKKGFLIPFIDEKKCVSCGICQKACPVINNREHRKEHIKCYALMASDDVREVSSSGGAFTLLAEAIIEQGGVVCGASWSTDYNAKHIVIDKLENIGVLRGSKYVQSDIKYTFREVKQYLNENRKVMFVGTPCQVDGLISYLGTNDENLITVDLLCCGIASNEIFKQFLKENYKTQTIEKINFKEKKPLGWGATTAYTFSDGTVEKTNIYNSVWMFAYLANYMDRDSCYSCKFNCVKRVGDISIGDFWGIEKYKAELNDKRGTTIAIVSSEKGDALIRQIREKTKKLEEVPIERGVPYNSALSTHVKLNDKRKVFYDSLKKMPFVAAVDRTHYGKKYSVGIVGWWYNLNYGGTLTYYALNNAIQKMGYSTLMIHRSTYGPMMPNENTIPMKFAKKHYNISRYYLNRDMHYLNYSCYAFVSGSDQLWSPYLQEYAGSEFFLSFVNDHNLKISYASSFGNVNNVQQDFKEKYKPLLNRFDNISVREDYAVELCKEEFGLEVQHVCDPIFLCNVEEYKQIANMSSKKYNGIYLLNFLLDPTPEKIAAYHFILNEKKMNTYINFTDLQEIEDKIKEFGEEGVSANVEIEEFLNGYVNAEFVITDSFHGTCLAIIFHKQFISIANKKRGEKRFISLLEGLGLMHRLVYTKDEIETRREELLAPIDYDAVDEKLMAQKIKAEKWLEQALSDISFTRSK